MRVRRESCVSIGLMLTVSSSLRHPRRLPVPSRSSPTLNSKAERSLSVRTEKRRRSEELEEVCLFISRSELIRETAGFGGNREGGYNRNQGGFKGDKDYSRDRDYNRDERPPRKPKATEPTSQLFVGNVGHSRTC